MPISLGDRLRQVITPAAPRASEPETDAAVPRLTLDAESPRSLDWRRRAVPLDGHRVADVLGGRFVESSEGALVVVDRYYAADRRHGRLPIGGMVDTLERGQGAFDVLARAWPGRIEGRYSSKLCLIDLETTGLAGGAGTQAFLVGCAVLDEGGLRVRQFLLPGFEHERALLGIVADWTRGYDTLASFNGRSFDLPLLETRYLLHRLPFPFERTPHLDALHPARRLWRERPVVAGPALDDDSCRLSVLERHLAGYQRIGDVGGFEIPSRYFQFVRSGDAHPLEAVLEHNRIDLVSLALVLARIVTCIEQGPSSVAHPRECLGLGRLYERAGACDEAEACFAHAAALAARVGKEPDVQADAYRRLALCRRRSGRLAEAVWAWEQVLRVTGCPAVWRREAREALAIHHEHRSRDLVTAREHAIDALTTTANARWRERAEYRLRRIERKLTARDHATLPIDWA